MNLDLLGELLCNIYLIKIGLADQYVIESLKNLT